MYSGAHTETVQQNIMVVVVGSHNSLYLEIWQYHINHQNWTHCPLLQTLLSRLSCPQMSLKLGLLGVNKMEETGEKQGLQEIPVPYCRGPPEDQRGKKLKNFTKCKRIETWRGETSSQCQVMSDQCAQVSIIIIIATKVTGGGGGGGEVGTLEWTFHANLSYRVLMSCLSWNVFHYKNKNLPEIHLDLHSKQM